MLIAMTLTAEKRLVRRRRVPSTSALATGEEVDDLDVLGNLGNAALQLGDDDAQQRFYALALSRAREPGAVTAVVYCLQRLCFGSLSSPATLSPFAAAPRRHSRSGRASASAR